MRDIKCSMSKRKRSRNAENSTCRVLLIYSYIRYVWNVHERSRDLLTGERWFFICSQLADLRTFTGNKKTNTNDKARFIITSCLQISMCDHLLALDRSHNRELYFFCCFSFAFHQWTNARKLFWSLKEHDKKCNFSLQIFHTLIRCALRHSLSLSILKLFKESLNETFISHNNAAKAIFQKKKLH